MKNPKDRNRIGSPTPSGYVHGGFEVDNNKSQQPHSGPVGGAAAEHMSVGHQPGSHWQPLVAKARARAAAGRSAKKRPHTEPINAQGGPLKRVKPD